MGRRRQSNFADPPRFHKKGNVWYHVSGTTPRVWTKLSSDRAEALRLWAQRETVRDDESSKLFSVVARRYVRDVLPMKAPRTQQDNEKELVNLLKVFGLVPIDSIGPMHVREYLDIRGRAAPVRANREKALFSHIFNKAREWGYTSAPNPCQGVKGFREHGRSRYVTDEEFSAVRAVAHRSVADAMDLALLTGQRPGDILKLQTCDIRNGALWIVQNKTRATLAIEMVGELAKVVEGIMERPGRLSTYLLQDDRGQPLTQHWLRFHFERARDAAGVAFQFRDIRAKAATDLNDLAHAQNLLAHKNRGMTEHYVRARAGSRVKPLR